MSSEKVVQVTDASFDGEVLNSATAVLVDFWAEWCFPCRSLSPVIDDIADEYEGRLKVVKVNVDDNSVVPARYGIRSIPSLLLFKNGKNVDSMVGNAPKEKLKEFIDKNI